VFERCSIEPKKLSEEEEEKEEAEAQEVYSNQA
jgi:hypothetical protein